LVGSGGDDVVEIKPPVDRQPGQIDPERYAEHLKQQLEIYCKAVAMSRVGILFLLFEFQFHFLLNFRACPAVSKLMGKSTVWMGKNNSLSHYFSFPVALESAPKRA
jgi:hypothetical protein